MIKLVLIKNQKIGLKLVIENRCYCFWVLRNHIATVLGPLFSLLTDVIGLSVWFKSILVLFYISCRCGFDIRPFASLKINVFSAFKITLDFEKQIC